jgi:hypothetical protein
MLRKDGGLDRRFKANKGCPVFSFIAAGVVIALMESFRDVSAGCMFMIAALGVASLALLAAGGAAAGLLF